MAHNYEMLSDALYYSQWGPLSELKELNPPAEYLAMKNETDKNTPLHLACANNHKDIVAWILKRLQELDPSDLTCLVNVQNAKGNTPLHWAAIKGNDDIVGMLLNYGANTMLKNRDNRTPIEEALLTNHTNTANIMMAFVQQP